MRPELAVPVIPADVPRHPAKFSETILGAMVEHVHGRVLDPFAGVGRVHALASVPGVIDTTGVELEVDWARAHPRTIVGNALALPFRAASFDTVATSPCYGNRLADHHVARDGSERHSYTHDIGHELHPDNAGRLHFGDEYRRFHADAWREVKRVLRPGGIFLLNVCDFISRGQLVPVVAFHRIALQRIGFTQTHEVLTRRSGLRHGANREARAEHEVILVAHNAPVRRPLPRRARAPRARQLPPQLDGQLTIYDVLGESP